MHLSLKRITCAALVVCLYGVLAAANNTAIAIQNQSLTYEAFYSLLTRSEAESLTFKNCTLYNNNPDVWEAIDRIRAEDSLVAPAVTLEQVTVSRSSSAHPTRFRFSGLRFTNSVEIRDTKLLVDIWECAFEDRFSIRKPKDNRVSISHTVFRSDFELVGDFESIHIVQSNFQKQRDDASTRFIWPVSWLISGKAKSVEIQRSTFQSDTTLDEFSLSGPFASCTIERSNFEVPLRLSRSFDALSITESGIALLDISEVSMPAANRVHLPFSDDILFGIRVAYTRFWIENGMPIVGSEHYSFKGEATVPTFPSFRFPGGDSVVIGDSLADYTFLYNKVFQSLTTMLGIYKEKGDLNSRVQCTEQLGIVKANYLRNKHRDTGSFKDLIDFRLHQLLGLFTDYGTSPAKGILVSFQTMLFFSLFYFFFYSEWDKISRDSLVERHSTLVDYLTNEQRIADFYSDRNKKRVELYESYLSKVNAQKDRIPWSARAISAPLYYSTMAANRMVVWIYDRFEIVSGKWAELPEARRRVASILIFGSIVAYTLRVIIIRALNSLFLSLNAFSTLGFGIIPVKGLLRYVAILEGFVGWIFLSLLLASFLNQNIL